MTLLTPTQASEIIGCCKDCKHWGELAWTDEAMARNARMRDQRVCKVPDPLFLAFGEGVEMEGIATKPNFGCVQFEAKAASRTDHGPKEIWTKGLK